MAPWRLTAGLCVGDALLEVNGVVVIGESATAAADLLVGAGGCWWVLVGAGGCWWVLVGAGVMRVGCECQ